MKVVFYIASFFPVPRGATYSAIRLASELRKQGVVIQWMTHDFDGTWKKAAKYQGFPVKSFYLNQAGKLKKIIGYIRFSRWLIQNKHRFEIFHIHGGGHMNILIAGWVKLLLPRKKVMLKCTMDGWDTPDGTLRLKYGKLLLWIYRRLDGIVAMTSGQHKKVLEYRCKGVSEVIPNGTDCDRYQPNSRLREKMRKRLGIPLDATVIMYLGSLEKRKGIDVLFKTWGQLLDRYPEVYLMTVGHFRKDQDVDDELLKLFDATGVDSGLLNHPRLIRVGHIEDAERYLQAADIFMFPSRQEGFGTVQTEAMACGLPCLVNDLPGVSCDIYPDESVGFRIKDNNVEEFVRIASELIDHPEKRTAIGNAARQRVVDHFSLESVGRRYLEFYQKMLENQ